MWRSGAQSVLLSEHMNISLTRRRLIEAEVPQTQSVFWNSTTTYRSQRPSSLTEGLGAQALQWTLLLSLLFAWPPVSVRVPRCCVPGGGEGQVYPCKWRQSAWPQASSRNELAAIAAIITAISVWFSYLLNFIFVSLRYRQALVYLLSHLKYSFFLYILFFSIRIKLLYNVMLVSTVQ